MIGALIWMLRQSLFVLVVLLVGAITNHDAKFMLRNGKKNTAVCEPPTTLKGKICLTSQSAALLLVPS
jgi:hypothetical protein